MSLRRRRGRGGPVEYAIAASPPRPRAGQRVSHRSRAARGTDVRAAPWHAAQRAHPPGAATRGGVRRAGPRDGLAARAARHLADWRLDHACRRPRCAARVGGAVGTRAAGPAVQRRGIAGVRQSLERVRVLRTAGRARGRRGGRMVVARNVRRGVQLSRGAAESRLTLRRRTVRPEILDELPATDARAIRSRRDLLRVNRVMGSCGILSRAVHRALASAPQQAPLHILELGAGDGSLALRIATRLATSWREAELTLLDRQALIAQATGTAFAHLGWTLRPLTLDVLQWARAPTQQPLSGRWNVVLTNLFLHHFEEDRLRELLSAVADRCDVFVACEPRRSLPALIGSRLLPALGG